MEITIEKEVKLLNTKSNFKISLCQTHFCISQENVTFLYGKDVQKTELVGHRQEVKCHLFVYNEAIEELLLYTCASDYLIVWNIEEVSVAQLNSEEIRGHVVCSISGQSVHHMTSSLNNELLCLTLQEKLIILSVIKNQIILNIPSTSMSCTQFINDKMLLTTSYNGNIFIRDLCSNGSIVFKYMSTTSDLGANFMSVCKSNEFIAIGTSTSMVHEFIYYDNGDLVENYKIDVDHSLMKIQHKNKTQSINTITKGQVLAATYVTFNSEDSSSINIFDQRRILLIATEQAMFTIDAHNNDVRCFPYKSQPDCEQVEIGPPVVGDAVFCNDNEVSNKVTCLVSFLFERKFVLYTLYLDGKNYPLNQSSVSIISWEPILPNSPLRLKSSSNKTNTKPKKSKTKSHKPLTFHSKVKSSGYNSSPCMKLFQPKTNFKNKHPPPKKIMNTKLLEANSTNNSTFDWSTGEVTEHRCASMSSKDCIVSCIDICEKNNIVACGLSNSTIQVTKLPLSNNIDKFRNLLGHNKSINSVHWSNQSVQLLTSSKDNSIKIWTPMQNKEVALEISLKDLIKSNKTSIKVSDDLLCSQFYYIDSFILSSISNSIYLFNYKLHEGPKNDVKRYLNTGKYKLVGNWPMKEAQKITCMTAANNVCSYIVIRGGSNKQIELFDMNKLQVVQTYKDVHIKQPHVVRHSTGSCMMSSISTNVFLSASQNDGIKLWDVRAKRCVRKYQQHCKNMKYDVVISSCGNYIACTEDDRNICFYDIRNEFPIRRLTTKNRTTCLKFTPNMKKILAGNDVSEVRSYQLNC